MEESLPQNEKQECVLESAEQFHNFQLVEVTQVDESKPWRPALEVSVTLEDGTVVEHVDANTAFYTFKLGVDEGKNLTVSAAAAGHIDALHIKGEEAGSKFAYDSLGELFDDIAEKIPESVYTEEGISAFDLEMGKSMGKEGVASLKELLYEGIVSEEEVEIMRSLKQEVHDLNLGGDTVLMEAFVQRVANTHPESNIQFQIIRDAVLMPVVDAPKRDTTKLFMVFGPGIVPEEKTMYTAAPGRNMPRHPNPDEHKNEEGVVDEETFKESSDAWFNTVMLVGVG